MDIKDAAKTADIKEADMKKAKAAIEDYMKEQEQSKAESDLIKLPEDNTSIVDIDECWRMIKGFIENEFKTMDKVEKIEDKEQKVRVCMGALSLMDKYRSTSLDVEFTRHIKFNIAPAKEGKENVDGNKL